MHVAHGARQPPMPREIRETLICNQSAQDADQSSGGGSGPI